MTKEEILLKMVEEMPYEISSETKPYLMEAMDIYAQQEAIAFAEWVAKNATIANYPFKKEWYIRANWYRIEDIKNTTELFQIFKQQSNG